jgi:ribosomal protein S19
VCICPEGLKRKPLALIKRLRKAKKEAPPMEKPAVVKTHLRNMIVVPEMIGSVVGIHSGKAFNQVEIKVRITYPNYPITCLSLTILGDVLLQYKWCGHNLLNSLSIFFL